MRHVLDGLNASWVQAARRLSPRVLVDLIAQTGPQLADFMTRLDPHAVARFPVAWADETASSAWFDIGRDYTERWHHQQQIRDAVGASGLIDPQWLHPVLAISMHALRRSFGALDRPKGTAVAIRVLGDAGGLWTLVKRDTWSLADATPAGVEAATSVTLSADTAWRLFFNQLTAQDAASLVETTGDATLAAAFLSTRAVMV